MPLKQQNDDFPITLLLGKLKRLASTLDECKQHAWKMCADNAISCMSAEINVSPADTSYYRANFHYWRGRYEKTEYTYCQISNILLEQHLALTAEEINAKRA